jgi:hypothetical protein
MESKAFFYLLTIALTTQPAMAQQSNEEMVDKAYDFCKQKGQLMTEAYIESKNYTVGVCSNSPLDACDYATKYFIFVQSSIDNKIIKMPTWPKASGKNFPNSTYTFQSTLNGITYEIKTSGDSISVGDVNLERWTSLSLKKAVEVAYSYKVNYYYGNIGMGC